jgi:probable HAF family extracellular repeat protein
MKDRTISACFSLLLLCGVGSTARGAAAVASFYPLGSDREAGAVVSHNGQWVVVRKTSGEVYTWSAASGQQTPMGFSASGGQLRGVSDDGSIVAGYTSIAFRWTAATGIVNLGDLPGGNVSASAWGMSGDGSVIVGQSSSFASGASRQEAFRWTVVDGMMPLGDFVGGTFNSRAEGVSADGATVVGFGSGASGTEAFRWTTAGGVMTPLGELPGGGYNSQAHAVSADGNVVAGHSSVVNFDEEPFRWTAASGIVGLGMPATASQSYAYGINGDGSTVVGQADHPPSRTGAAAWQYSAFIWDTTHGRRDLQTALRDDYGLTLSGWTLESAFGISDDGRTIVGSGIDPLGARQGWVVVVVPEPNSAMLIATVSSVLVTWRRRL